MRWASPDKGGFWSHRGGFSFGMGVRWCKVKKSP
jgi:hypothetical protein